MIVGTAGHIDHGKTSLVRALTGIDTDRLKEEKARGISIDLGFAYWPRPSGDIIGFVDVPGHERLVHTMLAGATGIDFVLLVVAADDGVMPQTREHLAIIDLLGLDRGLVVINKCDLVDADRISAVKNEITTMLAGTGLRDADILPVSATTRFGFDELTQRLDAACATASKRSDDGLFRLAVDRCFTLEGLGTAVSGTVLSGSVGVGDQVIVSPSGLEARVRSINAQNRPVERGAAGQRCALVLAGPRVSKETVRRGDVIVDASLHHPTSRIDVSLQVLGTEARAVGQWFPVKVHHASAEVPGRVVVLSDAPIAPGARNFAQLVLERPIAAVVGDPFVVRDTSSSRTVGGGRIIDVRAPARRRRTSERRAQLEALAEPDPQKAIQRILEGSTAWFDLAAFCQDRALGADAAERLARALNLVLFKYADGLVAMRADVWRGMQAQIGTSLDECHAQRPDLPGMAIEALRLATSPQLPARLFMIVLRRLSEAGEVAVERSWVRRPGHRVTFSAADEQLWARIVRELAPHPYKPPRVRDISKTLDCDEAAVRRLMRMASRRGDVDEIAPDHFFTRASIASMAAIVQDVAAKAPDGKFSAADVRDRLDNGRKVAIQILEFFDRHGFTIRRGDVRRINPARVDFFAPARTPDQIGGVPLPVERPVFKTGWGRETVSGGFDSHPPPPLSRAGRR